MDGKDLLRRLRQIMQEDGDDGWLDKQTSFDYLYEAACAFVDRTNCITGLQTIQTTSSQHIYRLKPDFLKLYAKDRENEYFIKYYDVSADDYYNIGWRDMEDLLYDYYADHTAVAIPSFFTVINETSVSVHAQVTGNATAAGTSSGGQCTLTDAGETFTYVAAGDIVHNLTDSSHGIVLSNTSAHAVVTALFGGANNDWGTSDAYVIQPQARFSLLVDPPPNTSADAFLVPYVQRPTPVYSDYGMYRFPQQYTDALVKYAYWLYKYRDREPDYGDRMYQFWDMKIRQYAVGINKTLRSKQIKVNMRKRNY